MGNLGIEVGDDLLTQTFSRYPSFNKAKVVREKKTQKSRGFGFVSFADGVDFARAIREMDGATVNGQQIKVNEAKPREGGRGGGRGGYGGGFGGGRGGGGNQIKP